MKSIEKHPFCKSMVWLERDSNPWLPAQEAKQRLYRFGYSDRTGQQHYQTNSALNAEFHFIASTADPQLPLQLLQREPFLRQFSRYALGVSTCSQLTKSLRLTLQWHRKMLINQITTKKIPNFDEYSTSSYRLLLIRSMLWGSFCGNTIPVTALVLEPMRVTINTFEKM